VGPVRRRRARIRELVLARLDKLARLVRPQPRRRLVRALGARRTVRRRRRLGPLVGGASSTSVAPPGEATPDSRLLRRSGVPVERRLRLERRPAVERRHVVERRHAVERYLDRSGERQQLGAAGVERRRGSSPQPDLSPPPSSTKARPSSRRPSRQRSQRPTGSPGAPRHAPALPIRRHWTCTAPSRRAAAGSSGRSGTMSNRLAPLGSLRTGPGCRSRTLVSAARGTRVMSDPRHTGEECSAAAA
jgi:hypothetical protein